ncbi:MAG: restriction endonuclease subunit S [Acidiferrobacteraceae bacterium]
MAGEWREVSIEEIASKIAMGPFGSDIKTDNFVPVGVPVIRGGNLTSGRFHGANFVFLTEAKADELANANAFPGDLVFTHRGTLGQVGLVPAKPFRRYVVSQSQMKLRCDPNSADPTFMYYFFRSPVGQHALLMNTSQTGVPAISRPTSSLKSIRLSLPPLPEQRAIAHMLGTLDDKIELNRRMNETLEAMARGFFKSWFVDFDPVRAKMEGRDTGLPKEIADLFPDSFEDSEMGEIPNGWRVGVLSDLATLNPETWSKDTRPTVIRYVDLSNTKWGRIEEVTAYAQLEAPSRAQRVLRPQDTMVGTVRPGNGSYALISQDGLTGSTGFAVLRPLRTEYAEFVYLAATATDNIDRLAHLADGAAYPAVRPEVIAATQTLKVPDRVIERFARITGPCLAKIAENDQESRILATLRNTLLPKLISGELCVPDVKQFSAEAKA